MIPISSLPKIIGLDSFYRCSKPSIISVPTKSLLFDYLYYPKGSNSLIVFLPSAQEPPRKEQPYFYRWSYSTAVSSDVLCVADPTAYLNENILGGWLLGIKNCWALEEISRQLIDLIIEKDYETIIFSGSSMGGFNAIQAATLLEQKFSNQKRVYFISENGQLSLLEYQYSLDLLAMTVWGVTTLRDIPIEDRLRIDAISLMKHFNVIPKGYAVFKESDEHHFKIHRKILQKFLSESNSSLIECSIIPFDADKSGHTPIDLKYFQSLVKSILEPVS